MQPLWNIYPAIIESNLYELLKVDDLSVNIGYQFLGIPAFVTLESFQISRRFDRHIFSLKFAETVIGSIYVLKFIRFELGDEPFCVEFRLSIFFQQLNILSNFQ